MKRLLGILALSGLLVAATPASFGGWATVTLLDVPEYLEVGRPTTLSFKIRQHGQTVIWDREPSLVLPSDGLLSRVFGRDQVRARKSEAWGVYEATITPETVGELPITIDLDLFGLQVALLPFRVVAPGAAPALLSDHERGRQLFVAKGCVSCHAKMDDDQNASFRYLDFGPSLVGRTFPEEYLTMKMQNPAEGRTASGAAVTMPKLELDTREIDRLVRYLNAIGATGAGGDDSE